MEIKQEKDRLVAGAGRAAVQFGDGYFPTSEYDAQHDEVHARALLLQKGEEKIGLVCLELPSVRPWELTDELRKEAGEIFGTDRDHTWLCVTHNLSGPHVPPEEEKRKIHLEAVRCALTEAALHAVRTMRPARVACGEGTSFVNANRDVHSADGWWVGIAEEGPSDKTLSALCLQDEDGGNICVLFSYALKSSVMEGTVMSDGKKYVSSELSGRACRLVEEKLDTVAIFLMSAAGDQVPREKSAYLALDEEGHFREVNLAEQGFEICERLGCELGEDVLAAVAAAKEEEADPVLKGVTAVINLPGQQTYPSELPAPPVLSWDYPSAPDETLEMGVFVIGQTALLALKSEVTTPIFTEIRKNSPFAHTMMGTLINGGQGYIGTDLDFERFSYPALHSPFAKGADRAFIRFADETLRKQKEETA